MSNISTKFRRLTDKLLNQDILNEIFLVIYSSLTSVSSQIVSGMEWKSGRFFHYKDENFELFCTAWDNGQLSFMAIRQPTEDDIFKNIGITVFELETKKYSEDYDGDQQADLFTEVCEKIESTDFLSSKLLCTDLGGIANKLGKASLHGEDSKKAGTVSEYSTNVDVDDTSHFVRAMDDLKLIKIYLDN